MPRYVQWERDGKVVPVQKVDDEIREYMGLPPDKDKYCAEYTCLSLTAIACAKGPAGEVTKEALETSLARVPADDADGNELYREFLLRRFEVKCWYCSA